jgi:hypothetical protein
MNPRFHLRHLQHHLRHHLRRRRHLRLHPLWQLLLRPLRIHLRLLWHLRRHHLHHHHLWQLLLRRLHPWLHLQWHINRLLPRLLRYILRLRLL